MIEKQLLKELQPTKKDEEQIPGPVRKTLRERADCYGGTLNLSDETDREEPAGDEVWKLQAAARFPVMVLFA